MLKALLATLGFCAVTAHAAAPLTTVSITGGIPEAPAGERTNLFFRATFWVYYDGVHPVVLSSAADGSGSSYVDDVLELYILHPDKTTAYFSHNYSDGCMKSELAPKDISSYLHVGLNRITAELKDFCGDKVSATPLFLSTVPAP